MSEETTIDQEVIPAPQEAETPVESLADEQVEQEVEEATTSEDSGDDSAADRPKPKGVQKRIDELTANWRNTERDRDYWRDLAMQTVKQPQAKPEPEAPQPPAEKPHPDSFDNYDSYLEALTDWKLEERVREQRQQQEKQSQQIRRQEAEQGFKQRAAQVRNSHEDFDSVAFNPSLPVSDAMAAVLLDSEKGPEVLYHLGSNPQEASRIASLPPHLAAVELGKIEARLSMPAPKKHTKAPAPIEPISGRRGGGNSDPEKMSTAEWMKWRQGQVTS